LILREAFLLTRSWCLTNTIDVEPHRLKQTFKLTKGSTVARAFVFHRYQQFCIDMRIESTSQSAFGRILKDVFPNVRCAQQPQHRAPTTRAVIIHTNTPHTWRGFCGHEWWALFSLASKN
jgi:hypothetical protein